MWRCISTIMLPRFHGGCTVFHRSWVETHFVHGSRPGAGHPCSPASSPAHLVRLRSVVVPRLAPPGLCEWNVRRVSAMRFDEDVLAVLFEHLGLQHLGAAAATCASWAAAAGRTTLSWRILAPQKTLGGGRGTAPGQLQRPTCLVGLPSAIRAPAAPEHDLPVLVQTQVSPPMQTVAIADTFNHRLVCVDSDGEPTRLIGVAGHEVGEFSFPRGLAYDGAHIYVAETGWAPAHIDSRSHLRPLSRTFSPRAGNHIAPQRCGANQLRLFDTQKL